MTQFIQDSLWNECLADLKIHASDKQHSLKNLMYCFIFSRGFHVLFLYRLQRRLIKIPVIKNVIWYFASCAYSCDISFFAKLEGGLYLPHPTGIVISQNATIFKGTTILQQVTIGIRSPKDSRSAIVYANCYLGAGSKILGAIILGEGSIVGANSVVLKDVPAGKLAVGVPAIIKP